MALGLAAAPVMAQGPRPAVSDSAPAVDEVFVSDRIHIEVTGRENGPDIILIPGLASTSAVWAKLVPVLEGRYRLHLVNVRGFGEYPPQGNARGHLTTEIASEIKRYIREGGLERPAIIGHSMGGQLALRVAADEGEGISKVMVLDSSPFFPSLINRGATRADVEPLARLVFQGVMMLGDEMLRSTAAQSGIDLGAGGDHLFNSLGWQGGDRRVLAQGLYEVLTNDLRYRLPDITAPVTVVYGWSDKAENPRAQVDDAFRYGYMNLRRPARFERMNGAEHMVMIDTPKQLELAVKRFLAD
ncbi:alpha/beta fold hydrolase [Brevundimonas sp.]|uniref:alpha/beta fold hydrolase n=1 Tax=Brevundimonas sp. TaxID=1871086 RepID=UPI002FC58AF1